MLWLKFEEGLYGLKNGQGKNIQLINHKAIKSAVHIKGNRFTVCTENLKLQKNIFGEFYGYLNHNRQFTK